MEFIRIHSENVPITVNYPVSENIIHPQSYSTFANKLLKKQINSDVCWACHQFQSEPHDTGGAIFLFSAEKGVVISMSPLQNNNPCLPIQYCATSIRTVGANGASAAIREGQPADRWGSAVQTTPSARCKHTNTLPSVCSQVMIVFYEKLRPSASETEIYPYTDYSCNKIQGQEERYLPSVLLHRKH